MITQLSFAVLGACMVSSGALAVTSRRLVHSVLWLAVTLVATAAVYVTLDAPFMAGIQVLLYTGGVITLMLFGVMLTDLKHEVSRENPSHRKAVGALVAGGVFGILTAATLQTSLPVQKGEFEGTAAEIGRVFLGQHLLAFEALSILLLAAMLGAIVLSRRTDP